MISFRAGDFMKEKIIYALHFIWMCVTAFTLPLCAVWIHGNISGYAKWFGHELIGEKKLFTLLGYFEIVLWVLLAFPSLFHVIGKTWKKKPILVFIPVLLYVGLITLSISLFFGGMDEFQNCFLA